MARLIYQKEKIPTVGDSTYFNMILPPIENFNLSNNRIDLLYHRRIGADGQILASLIYIGNISPAKDEYCLEFKKKCILRNTSVENKLIFNGPRLVDNTNFAAINTIYNIDPLYNNKSPYNMNHYDYISKKPSYVSGCGYLTIDGWYTLVSMEMFDSRDFVSQDIAKGMIAFRVSQKQKIPVVFDGEKFIDLDYAINRELPLTAPLLNDPISSMSIVRKDFFYLGESLVMHRMLSKAIPFGEVERAEDLLLISRINSVNSLAYSGEYEIAQLLLQSYEFGRVKTLIA